MSDVLTWAKHVLALPKDTAPHLLLDVSERASATDAQAAFHRVARRAHPDLHRGTLSPEELEVVTSAYARVAGAYQSLRVRPAAGAAAAGTAAPKPIPVTPSGVAPTANAATQMSPRALVYYRKAELALRQGNFSAALLQLKMAIGADPSSSLLRTALAEVERELRNVP